MKALRERTVLIDAANFRLAFKLDLGQYAQLLPRRIDVSVLPTVPLVEFSFDSARAEGVTVATVNPGFAYVAVTWQIAAEAVVPLNRAGGNATGFRAQLFFFINDFLPSVFGKTPQRQARFKPYRLALSSQSTESSLRRLSFVQAGHLC